jgi:hypothetical protein
MASSIHSALPCASSRFYAQAMRAGGGQTRVERVVGSPWILGQGASKDYYPTISNRNELKCCLFLFQNGSLKLPRIKYRSNCLVLQETGPIYELYLAIVRKHAHSLNKDNIYDLCSK